MAETQTNKPDNLAPVRSYIYTTMEVLQDQASSQSSEQLLKAALEVSSRNYVVHRSNGTLQTELDSFGFTDYLGQPLKDRYKRFSEDLDYIKELENHGLGGINTRIHAMMSPLQPPHSGDISDDYSKTLIKHLNDILGRAIHLYPSVARGIEVTLPANKRNSDFTEIYGGKYNRKGFSRLDLHGFALNDSKLETLVLPLPYSGKINDHKLTAEGSYNPKKFPQKASIYFTMLENRCGKTSPGLAVQIGPDVSSCFSLDEVESVKVVGQDFEFSPALEATYNHGRADLKVRDRPNWIRHYLEFRGFELMEVADGAITDHEATFGTDKLDLYSQFLLLPGRSSELTKIEPGNYFSGDTIRQGFLALDNSNPRSMRMYEIRDLPGQGNSFKRDAPGLLDRIFKESTSKFNKSHVQRYIGGDIVTRLAAIPRGL